jgi:pimeloyl-ACP methyl ester carboxylesterase
MPGCHERQYEVGPVVLSGIEAGPVCSPRGVVVALHGSGYVSRYWDCPHNPANSLLRLGDGLGYRVVAIDRPGYGASRTIASEQNSLDAQAAVLSELIAGLRTESALVPVFLIGHSLGSLLAVRLAAREAAAHVAAIDVMGLPVQWRDDVRQAAELSLDGAASRLSSPDSRLAMYFGPPGTYDPRVLEMERDFSERIPRREMSDILDSPRMLREMAPDVRVPVQCTVAEFDGSIAAGPDAVARDRELFAGSPRAVAHWQRGAGHNVSLHWVGRAYHLRALAFFEEVAALAGQAAPVGAFEVAS